MFRPARRFPASLLAAIAAAALLAACSGGGSSPAPSDDGGASPAPSSPPADVGFVIHASRGQALPPRSLFGNVPALVVTANGRVLTPGVMTDIFPGPLVAPIVERTISPAGTAALLQAAKDAGILVADGDFTGGALPMGAAAGRLRIVVDGMTYDVVGDTNAAVPCPPTESCPDPVPGTPAAFATYWYRLLDMASWLAPDLGPEAPHVPASYATIVGPPPERWEGESPVAWPVTDPALDQFGDPVRGEPGTRCGIAAGDLAATLRSLFDEATVLTPWVATEMASATHGLKVRPLLPGDEDPCAPIVE